MKKFVVAGILLISTLGLGGCATLSSGPRAEAEPRVLVYWNRDPGIPACPDTAECLTLHTDPPGAQQESEPGADGQELQLSRLDVRLGGGNRHYLATWGKSEQEHVVEHLAVFDRPTFEQRHEVHSKEGRELLHLSVYPGADGPEASAIWRSRPNGGKPFRKDIVRFASNWQQLVGRHAHWDCGSDWGITAEECDDYSLVGFEAFHPSPADSKARFVGIWRYGADTSHPVVSQCVIRSDDTIDAEIFGRATEAESSVPACKLVYPPSFHSHGPEDDHDHGEDGEEHPICPVMKKIVDAGKNGLRPTEMEYFRDSGSIKLAVLLVENASREGEDPHASTGGGDWLLVPATVEAARCRDRMLRKGTHDGDAIGLGVSDLAWLEPSPTHRNEWLTFVSPPRIETPSQRLGFHGPLSRMAFDTSGLSHSQSYSIYEPPPSPFHNGLIHDGGTSDPPDQN